MLIKNISLFILIFSAYFIEAFEGPCFINKKITLQTKDLGPCYAALNNEFSDKVFLKKFLNSRYLPGFQIQKAVFFFPLKGYDLSYSNLTEPRFLFSAKSNNFSNAKLIYAYGVNNDFSQSLFKNAQVIAGRFFRANFSYSNMESVNFNYSDLSFSKFIGANLKSANFSETNLIGTRFDNAIIDNKTVFPKNFIKKNHNFIIE